MQRLFSMFPRGAPGLALALLRCAVAAALWSGERLACLPSAWGGVACLLLALSLCLGILTPAAALASAALHGASLACGDAGPTLPGIVAIANAAALALLGPGAYSIDCRLFGRRVFLVSGGNEKP